MSEAKGDVDWPGANRRMSEAARKQAIEARTQPMPRRALTALAFEHQTPILECVNDTPDLPRSGWRIWLNYNRACTAGTYLTLHHDGMITRSTIQPTGEIINVITVTPKGPPQ